MRISTVSVLAALGMTLTSAAVWSLTSPAEAASRDDQVVGSLLGDEDPQTDPEDAPPEPKVDKSSFVAGKSLMLEGRLGHANMLASAGGETFLYLDVRSELEALEQLGARSALDPVNLAIVIDHSGSMKGQRGRNAVEAAAGMIQRLRDGDTVSVVSYSAEADIIVPVTTIDAVSRQRVIDSVRRGVASRPKGATCISCGIELGMRTFERRRAGIDRMLLLSDGEANRGVKNEAGIRVLARQARNRGVTISSIGVDIEYNERLMSALAREANGRHYFSETGANLEQIFDQELESLVKTVGKDGELTVELAPGVRVAEVFDRSYQQLDRRVIVPMGTFTAGEAKTFLMRLELPPSPAGERPVANVTFSYDDLSGTTGSGECFGELALQMTEDPGEISPLDAVVLSRLTRSETARTLEQANAAFAAGRGTEAQRIVDEHLDRVGTRQREAAEAAAKPGFADPFSRNLDEDFASQAGVLNDTDAAFEQAAEEPAPATRRRAKEQIRRNATKADAFSL